MTGTQARYAEIDLTAHSPTKLDWWFSFVVLLGMLTYPQDRLVCSQLLCCTGKWLARTFSQSSRDILQNYLRKVCAKPALM